MNNATFMGRIGKDAELRYTQSGSGVTSVNIAVDRRKPGVEKQEPLWVKCVFWGKLAEGVAQYLTKGTMIAVGGPVDIEKWEDREGGQHFTLAINVKEFSFGGGNKKESNEAAPGQHSDSHDDIPEPKPVKAAVVDDQEIPF